jgi:hypothetical protein
MKGGQQHLKEEIMFDLKTRIGCLAFRTDVKQEEEIKAWLKEMTACQEATEDCIKGEGQPREDEGRPGIKGRLGGYFRRKLKQNGHHGSRGQSRKIGSRSGALGSP